MVLNFSKRLYDIAGAYMIHNMTKNTDKLVCIQYDSSLRFSNLASAIPKEGLTKFTAVLRRFPVSGKVI
ncbi:hypothetical protein EG487_07135 [Paenibacillus polymyxa]|nr:hypothetical protein EG487_07135 [Paenibacillus polymyxa]